VPLGAAGGAMPRKFKVPAPPSSSQQQEGNNDAKVCVFAIIVIVLLVAKKVNQKVLTKVKREFIPQWEKRKWTAAQSLFYPYDKIKSDFELQGLFTRMKEKCWMAIYFDMILLYLPTKEGPPDMEDKLEGKPFA
jgi:hypothetical protein